MRDAVELQKNKVLDKAGTIVLALPRERAIYWVQFHNTSDCVSLLANFPPHEQSFIYLSSAYSFEVSVLPPSHLVCARQYLFYISTQK
jgi:hypothetical protein